MQEIIQAAESILAFMRDMSLNNSTIKTYRIQLHSSIIPYCEAKIIRIFTDVEMQTYSEEQVSKADNGEISRSTMMQRKRAAALLADCMEGRAFLWARKNYSQIMLCEHFKDILLKYRIYLSESLALKTIQVHISIIQQFLKFNEQSNIFIINDLTSSNVKEYITNIAPNYKSSMSTLTGALKKFLSYLAEMGFVSVSNEWMLINPAPGHKKVLPCFSDVETNDAINSVNRSSPIGKRDYAIIMLALWTGLRGVDILDLKRADINWKGMVINVIQDKTNIGIQPVLTPVVGNAIKDYILNGRPETDSPFIFVRHKRPYDRLSNAAGVHIMDRYFSNAGIFHETGDGRSFHAFRRTFGTRLVRTGVPIRSVGDMLGQVTANAAKRYVSLDLEGLRPCCLDISMLGSKKEGLL